jgi:hypothetical protein
MLFELREEQVKRLPTGVIEVIERRIATRDETEIKPKFLDMKVGQRRNMEKEESLDGLVIHSIVRTE